MAIQDDNTLVTKGDLKDLFANKIAPYLGANLALKSNVSEFYSTDEKIIGVWIDGKPLYQKTITVNTGSTSPVDKYLNIGASVDKVIDCDGILNHQGYFFKLPRYSLSGNSLIINFVTAINNTEATHPNTVRIYLENTSYTNDSAHIVVQYTKTTDAANSAVTIPGCYDINFPNTWPANKEIYFGNGLYGIRATGNIENTVAAGSNTWIQIINANTGLSTSPIVVSMGGNITCYESTIAKTINTPINTVRVTTGNNSGEFKSNLYFASSGGLRAQAISTTNCTFSLTTSDTYDIWTTYKK